MLRPLLALTTLSLTAQANSEPTPLRAGILIGVGDRIAIVQQEASVGSHLKRNVEQSMRLGPEVFQHDAVMTAAQALGAAIPGVKPVELPVRPDVQKQPWRVDGDKLIVEPVLAQALERAKVTMLVLVEPLSAPAEMKMAELTLGHGRLEGMGFYVDNETPVRRIDTGDQAVGYLGLYAYFRTVIVALPSMKVQCQRRTTDSLTYLADGRSPGTHPWQALTLERKIDDLRGIVRRELSASLKHCLASGQAQMPSGPSGS
ncbi:hypothetical protein [Roseateles asaccharophilus]|uniref:Uncharacterized protein n=1 Tax=Roseateles asaccharophilus TaxID=582607 RepID=A0ABU2A754_9BURK|nr:hypothetical protein [Roseateles asaccharophilus]MDR7332428.1 hypothetical protein [Roseateles asaccharophilus]